ncbi:E3 ubiquitin ligase PQT3-like [Silene latifolia]|uniref:E3 ubiquitin ligase PQT3-like n=1 Tax=Silene latifolia TaxID=37657 RepID=UPI003D76DD81
MAVYYKFKSAKDYDSITIDGHFITVANLKERIFESKHLGRGTDFDLVVTNAQTNEEYLDEAMLIPKNTSVLIRRVPGRPRMAIVTQPDEPKVETEVVDDQLANSSNFMTADSVVMNNFESDFGDFGNDLYATIPEVPTGQSSNPMQDSAPPSKADEESKLKAFLDNPGFDWQRQGGDGFGQGRGFARGGRGGGRGFGRGIGLERKTPPQGYVCHRCKVPGHFIQHCPTNGDPTFDLRKVKPPTGIPKSMLVPTPDGLYSLPSGTSAVLKPNEAAFEREIEGLPSTRSMGDLPPELHCPLCKEVMKDAVLTSKCCFRSFCDKCIRDHIISKSICVCGANNILADDLLPNKTVRDTINRILESGNSSADNVGSAAHVQDMESARCVPPKNPSPTQSAASKGEQKIPAAVENSPVKEVVNGNMTNDAPLQQSQLQNSAKENIVKVPDVSEATHESASVKEHVSHSNVLPVEEEVQQKVAASDAGKKKKKKKKVLMPPNGAEMPWMGMQPVMDGYGGPANFNPYWQGGMQPPMDGYMGPFPGNMPYNMGNMGYGPGPMDMPFNMGYCPGPMDMPQNFMFPPQMMPPPPPQRDLAAEFGMGMNVRPPPMISREEFEARKADLRRKREMERRFENRELPPRDHDFREGSSNANPLPMKSKPKPLPIRRSSSPDRYDDRDRDRERERPHDRHRERERSRDRSSVDYDRERDRESHYRRSSHSHRSDRVSSERRDKEISRLPAKRKAEHLELDHDIDRPREREREREREHDRERTHRHRSESKPPATAAESAAAAAQAAIDKKHKASVFSRISFPEEELPKKRKVSDEPKPKSKSAGKDHETGGSGSGSGHHHQKRTATTSSMANGYHDHETVKKSVMAAMEYESSDDERHFKRKPSRYEPSPPPREELDETAGRRHRKHR